MFRDEFYASMVEVGANIKVRAYALGLPASLSPSFLSRATLTCLSPLFFLVFCQAVIIDASGVLEMDLSALAVIDELVSEMQKQKVRKLEERRERKGGGKMGGTNSSP